MPGIRKEQRRGRRIFLPVDLYLAGRVGNVDFEFEPRRYKKMTREDPGLMWEVYYKR
jgi:hypothetical protein